MRFLATDSRRARWQQIALALLLVGGPLLLWGELAEDVWKRESFRFDDPILLWLHRHSNPTFDTLMLGLSLVGGYPLLGISGLLFVALFLTARRREALFVALCIGGVSVLNVGAKMIFQRTRPDLWVSLAPEPDYSFPSGHAMLSSAFIGMVLVLIWHATRSSPRGELWRRIAAPIGIVLVGAVGLSRLYLGVHYPSDILAGWLASFSWIALMSRVMKH